MNKLLITLIIVVAVFFRIYSLNSLPPLNADEAAIGYNVYSLLQTGKDEHGHSWPIHFESFGDYKPGGYFYIVLPFVKILGLTELAVRLPGALLGVLSVFIIYFLVLEIFKKRGFALLTAFLLAISPWHIHFSRGGWEVNGATTFILLGFYSFIVACKTTSDTANGVVEKNENNKFFYLSVFWFVLSIYTYHAARVVVPLLVISLVTIFRSQVFSNWRLKRSHIISALLGVLLCVPLLFDLLGPAGLSRATGVGLFADEGPYWRTNEQRGEHEHLTNYMTVVLHNKVVNYGLAFVNNYLEHFSGDFLFISGDDIQRNKVPEFGQLYLLQLGLLVIGFIVLSQNLKAWWPILAWLLIAPIPAALTFQSPHALRAQSMVVPLTIITAFGLYMLILWIHKIVKARWLMVTCYLFLGILFVWDFSRYLHEYYVHMPKEYPFSSQYGAREMVDYVAMNESKFKEIFITDRYDQPYILFLFYTKYDPVKFQNDHKLTPRDRFGFSTVRDFGKYHFMSIEWDKMRDRRNVMLVGTVEELKVDANSVHTVKFPNGSIAYKIVPL